MEPEVLKEVEKYQEESRKKSELDRISQSKEKSGVNTGLFCVNSITNEGLQIYRRLCLTTVGTGMVVGVPAHDKRDFEFAQKFKLPVIRVIESEDGNREEIDTVEKVYEGEGVVFNSGFLNGLGTQEARAKVGEYIKEKVLAKLLLDIIFETGYFQDKDTGESLFQ
jgi:leucyl-tRNA synthetase